MKNWTNKLMLLLALTMVGTLGIACGNDDDDDDDNPPVTNDDDDVIDPPTPDLTSIRVVHLSPDAPGVDVLANEELRAIENLLFGEGTAYLEVPEGTYRFDVVPADGMVDDAVFTIPEIPLNADEHYTAVAVGTLENLTVIPLVDDLSDPGEGMIRVRAIHAAPGVGEVDIWNIPETGEPAPLYENVPFAGVGEYLLLPAGTYTLGFDVDNDAMPDLTFTVGADIDGLVANIFAVNDDDGAVFLLAQLADGTLLRVDPN